MTRPEAVRLCMVSGMTDERLTAVVDRLGHHGLQPSGETAVAVREERREHEPDHAEVHLFGLMSGRAVD